MVMVNVQFSDATDEVIVSYFSGPQDPDVYPNQGTIDTSDARWKVFYDALDPITQSTLPPPY